MTDHELVKIVNEDSITWLCRTHNTSYHKLKWVKLDHPNIDLKKILTVDLTKGDTIPKITKVITH